MSDDMYRQPLMDEIDRLRAENEQLKEFVDFYIKVYARGMPRPTLEQEAKVMTMARDILAKTAKEGR